MPLLTALDPLSSLTTALKRDSIIPDVVPPSFQPTVFFSVVWPNGKEAIMGNELTKADTVDEPSINFTPLTGEDDQGEVNGQNTTYTLAFSDPDAPSRADPKYGQFRHWVITGLQSPATTTLSIENLMALKSKDATTPYRPPGPGPGTGTHRYVFTLFQEAYNAAEAFTIPHGEPEHGATLEERRNWNAVEFGERYGLKLVGVNYFILKAEQV